MKKIIIILTILLMVGIGLYFYYFKANSKIDTKKKFTFWSIQLKPIYEKEIKEVIKTFEQKHPDYKVVWVDIPIAEAQKRTLASILSSAPPDLVNLNPDFSIILAQKNALDFFKDEELKDYLPSLVNKLKYQGKIYAIPFYATSPTTIYNKTIYDKCISNGIVSSYDELFNISKQLKNCSKITPWSLNLNENDTLAKILNKYDISSLKTEAEKQKAREIYSKFSEMYKNELLPKDVLAINHREVIERYMSNQAIVVVAGSNFINMIKQNAPDIYKNSDITYQLTGSNKKFDVSLMNLIIPKKSQNKELAREFAFLLTNKENLMKLAKLTTVLPVNLHTLEDEHFKNCSNDLIDKARCYAVKQLNDLNTVTFGEKNTKTINEQINKTAEEILLNNANVEKKIDALSKSVELLQN